MHGKIVNSLVFIVAVVIGWTACLIFQNKAFLTLDCSISIAEVLTLIVEIFLAIFVANVIERSLQNKRVEKDFYLKELDDVLEILSELEKLCAEQNVLSFDVTVERLSRSRRILSRLWKLKNEYEKAFVSRYNDDYVTILATIKDIDSKLTDSKTLQGMPKVIPIKISKGKIYLNATVRPTIEDSISQTKANIFKMKILINSN